MRSLNPEYDFPQNEIEAIGVEQMRLHGLGRPSSRLDAIKSLTSIRAHLAAGSTGTTGTN